MRTLLGVEGEHDDGSVIFEREELESYGTLATCRIHIMMLARNCEYGHTRRIVEGMDVVLLGEPLAEWSLKCAQVGNSKLEDLRTLLTGQEERCLGVLVLLRLALRHGALCAGILGFSRTRSVYYSKFILRATVDVHLLQHVVVAWVCWRCRTLGGNFFSRIDSGPANSLTDLISHGGVFRVGGVLLLDSFRTSAGQSL